jgi:hypothetical protein
MSLMYSHRGKLGFGFIFYFPSRLLYVLPEDEEEGKWNLMGERDLLKSRNPMSSPGDGALHHPLERSPGGQDTSIVSTIHNVRVPFHTHICSLQHHCRKRR